MSDTSSKLDLSQLAVGRSNQPAPRLKVRRAWLGRYVVPGIILLGFFAMFGWAARDSFLPAQSITITPVVVSRAEVKQEGTPLFQAAGWVEPRPTPVIASALAPGVVKEMLVIEGQSVEKGKAVATLIDTDAIIALKQAQANHALQQAEVRRAEAAFVAAKTNLEKPLALQAELADAETLLAKTERELVNLPFALKSAKTREQLAAENVKRKEAAGDAIVGRLLREARAELADATNAVQEMTAREPTLQAQLKSLRQKRTALAERLKLLTDEKRAVAEAEANLAVSRAQAEQTALAVEAAELRLQRMTVISPISGRVLSLEARPGQRLSGINPHSEQGSSAVVSLYDPARLQVRVDVRLEDVPQVQLGQPTQIETAAHTKSIAGEVISVTTQADIQKNTLQVKVGILNPPDVIKPEMLSKVTFLAPPSPIVDGESGQSPLRLFIPRSLIVTGEGESTVWVANLTTGVASQKTVQVGQSMMHGDLVEITAGLLPTDKLIVSGRESLAEGTRVRVTGEDRTMSSSSWNENSNSVVDARTARTEE